MKDCKERSDLHDDAIFEEIDHRHHYLEKQNGMQDLNKALRKKIEVLIADNNSLCHKSNDLSEKLADSKKDAERLRKDLECLLAAKINSTNNSINTSQEEKFALIIKAYEAQCQDLVDRNNKLAKEVETIQAKLRQQTSYNCYQQGSHEAHLSSSKREIPHRYITNKALNDDDERKEMYFAEEENLSNHWENYEMERDSSADFSPSSLRKSSQEAESKRMVELECLVEELQREKTQTMEKFAEKENILRLELEKEFQFKLENEKSALVCCSDNKAIEEQQNMTMKLLKEMTQQKDELEGKYFTLKESVESQKQSGQQNMADLCREFADEKSELVTSYDEKIKILEEEILSLNQQLEEEKVTNEKHAELICSERLQHKEALLVYEKTIQNQERAASAEDPGNFHKDIEDLEQLKKMHEIEVDQLKQTHILTLEEIQREVEEKLELLLNNKLEDNTGECHELDQLQLSLQAEQSEMHERMEEMRLAFERDATELRQLLHCDKAKLRKQLRDEIEALREKLVEETEQEMKRNRQAIEEEAEKWMKKEECLERKQKAYLEDIEQKNSDLKILLSQSISSLQTKEEELKRIKAVSEDDDVKHLNDQLYEKNKILLQNQIQIGSLQNQINELIKQHEDTEKEQINSHHLQSLIFSYANTKLQNPDKHKEITTTSSNHMKLHDNKSKPKKENYQEVPELVLQTVKINDEEPKDDFASLSSLVATLKIRLRQTRRKLTNQMEKSKTLYLKLAKTENLVEQLYCENSYLMRKIQAKESRLKDSEKKLRNEIEKYQSIELLLKQLFPNSNDFIT